MVEFYLGVEIMKILLVEPGYKNKYPPMSLMKISTYHKSKGDFVAFEKGLNRSGVIWDRIYITTLFTFHYREVLKTIKHYKKYVKNKNDIFVGGIMASLLTEDLKKDSGLNNIIIGRLLNSSMLGFNDNVNIDVLPLDYDILQGCEYKYPSGDNFFAYTTRGCVNKCPFCAVPILEGGLSITNNIHEQISFARDTYGDKRNLLLLDNNVLALKNEDLQAIVNNITSLGFIKTPTFFKQSEFLKLSDAYFRAANTKNDNSIISQKLKELLDNLRNSKKLSQKTQEKIAEKVIDIGTLYEDEVDMILSNLDFFIDVEKKYNYKKPMQRYVDFNQGMDARLLTEEKMKILSALPIKPFRIAYDNIKYTDIYTKAIKLAARYGVEEFSNYLLYNFDDKPIELYNRLKINIDLAAELSVQIYSFPMKYEPIENKKRGYVGKNWNLYYLKSIKAILNVSKGVFSGDTSFFEKAFGKNEQEFLEILSMPKELITYRLFYENLNITSKWKKEYNALTATQKNILLDALSNDSFDVADQKIQTILRFYKNSVINKKNNILKI